MHAEAAVRQRSERQAREREAQDLSRERGAQDLSPSLSRSSCSPSPGASALHFKRAQASGKPATVGTGVASNFVMTKFRLAHENNIPAELQDFCQIEPMQPNSARSFA
jgi:hypothetical protein